MSSDDAAARGRASGLSTGWTVFSYLIGGMIAYGGIGWLIGHFTHLPLLFPLGMLTGLAISVGFIIYRYGRQGAAETAAARSSIHLPSKAEQSRVKPN
jgi:F0F1-type ATP synthase assembly protein I